jgi:hypothetical protein
MNPNVARRMDKSVSFTITTKLYIATGAWSGTVFQTFPRHASCPAWGHFLSPQPGFLYDESIIPVWFAKIRVLDILDLGNTKNRRLRPLVAGLGGVPQQHVPIGDSIAIHHAINGFVLERSIHDISAFTFRLMNGRGNPSCPLAKTTSQTPSCNAACSSYRRWVLALISRISRSGMSRRDREF